MTVVKEKTQHCSAKSRGSICLSLRICFNFASYLEHCVSSAEQVEHQLNGVPRQPHKNTHSVLFVKCYFKIHSIII